MTAAGTALAVSPAWPGLGVGRITGIPPELLRQLEENARRRGDRPYLLATRRARTHSMQSYLEACRRALREVVAELERLPTPEARRKWLLDNIKLGHPLDLGPRISSFDLPAYVTCPGYTPFCRMYCYAGGGSRFQISKPKMRSMFINLLASLLPGFPEKLAGLVEREKEKGRNILRLHSSGDIYDTTVLAKWLALLGLPPERLKRLLDVDLGQMPRDWYLRQLVRAALLAPSIRFYTYTRSWRNPAIQASLRELRLPGNMVVYLSVDKTVPEAELRVALQLSREKGYPIAWTGVPPVAGRTARFCYKELWRLQHPGAGKSRTRLEGTCSACLWCPYGRGDVVFAIH